jgi:pyruvate-ferredoxin/flavodoxin oxidoreductase
VASPVRKKDLGLMAMTYGNVYVASVAMGAKDEHTLKAFLEAEAYNGPSLIIAYSHVHRARHRHDYGHDRSESHAVESGQWLLYRFNPERAAAGENPSDPRFAHSLRASAKIICCSRRASRCWH